MFERLKEVYLVSGGKGKVVLLGDFNARFAKAVDDDDDDDDVIRKTCILLVVTSSSPFCMELVACNSRQLVPEPGLV